MRTLPHTFPAEEKRKWEVELRMLWEQIDKNLQDSPQHTEAKGKLFDFSNALISRMQAQERSTLQLKDFTPLVPVPPGLNNIPEILKVSTMTSSIIPQFTLGYFLTYPRSIGR
jgi:hypothetical protein